MAQVPRSSFIPKQTQSTSANVRRRRRFHVFRFLSSVIFLGSLVLAGVAFFYKDHTLSQLQEQKTALANERDRFNEGDIQNVRTFDRRLKAASFLLDNHIVPSKIFDALELSTMQRVQFTAFNFVQRPSQGVTLNIQGGTEEFKTAALQSLQFGDDPLLKDVEFTEIGTADIGVPKPGVLVEQPPLENVHAIDFTVHGNLTASALMYEGKGNVPNGDVSGGTESEDAASDNEESPDEETADAAPEGGESLIEEEAPLDGSDGTDVNN